LVRGRLIWLVSAILAVAVWALTAPASAQTSTVSSTGGDVVVAGAGTIQAGDVPASFSQTSAGSSQKGPRPKASSSSYAAAKTIPGCKNFIDAVITPKAVTATATGPTLTDQQQGSQVSSAVEVFAAATQAKKNFALLTQSSLAICLSKYFKFTVGHSIEQQSGTLKSTKVTATVTPHQVPPVGDQTIDYQVRVDVGPVRSSGATLTVRVYDDWQFVRVSRALTFYSFLGTGQPLDSVQQPAVTAAVDRLTQALTPA
jgi:hypothetical protein